MPISESMQVEVMHHTCEPKKQDPSKKYFYFACSYCRGKESRYEVPETVENYTCNLCWCEMAVHAKDGYVSHIDIVNPAVFRWKDEYFFRYLDTCRPVRACRHAFDMGD